MLRSLARWLTWAGLAALFGFAGWTWLSRETPRKAVCEFFDAVTAGDEERTLALMHPDQQRLYEQRRDRELADGQHPLPWAATPGLSFRVERIEDHGSRAEAQVVLFYQGLRARPKVHLQRDEYQHWRIATIENLDPRETFPGAQEEIVAEQEKRTKRANLELAKKLEDALDSVPGVVVHREESVGPTLR